MLWHLATSGRVEERLAYLGKLAAQPPDAKALPRWQRLARDPEKALREKALAVLAQHDAAGSVDLFVEQLPLVDYTTQQVLVEALTRAAASQGARVRRPHPAADRGGRARRPARWCSRSCSACPTAAAW